MQDTDIYCGDCLNEWIRSFHWFGLLVRSMAAKDLGPFTLWHSKVTLQK